MKKSAIIGFIVAGIAAVLLLIYILTGGESIDTAIEEFEDGDYIEAIEILNRLLPAAGYE